MCKFRNAIINRQILNSTSIFIYSHLEAIITVPTKSLPFLTHLIQVSQAPTHKGIARDSVMIHVMYAAVLPVLFLLITISCYMFEMELILGVFMCITPRASSHVPSCMCTVDWASSTLQLTTILFCFLVTHKPRNEKWGKFRK